MTPESGQLEEEEKGDQGRVAVGAGYTPVDSIIIDSFGYS